MYTHRKEIEPIIDNSKFENEFIDQPIYALVFKNKNAKTIGALYFENLPSRSIAEKFIKELSEDYNLVPDGFGYGIYKKINCKNLIELVRKN